MRKWSVLIFFLLALFFVPQIAWADGAELRSIEVDGIEVRENQTCITNQSLTEIIFEYRSPVTDVKLGTLSPNSSYKGTEFTFKSFPLKPGNNKLTVQATAGEGKAVKVNFNINYVSAFNPGTKHSTELPASGKISIFEKNIELTFPKNTIILDRRNKPLSDQRIEFFVSILKPHRYPNKFRTPVSNIVNIESTGDGVCFTNPGTIQIKFDGNVPDSAADTITIMYKESGTLDWENIGAIVNGKSKIASASFRGFGDYGVFNAGRFFEDYNWSRIYAEPLWSKGIMKIRKANGDIIAEDNYSTGLVNLGVENNCLRLDFASMIVRAFGYHQVPQPFLSRFSDLSSLGSEDLQDIETAAAYNIVEGKSRDKFDPTGELTREESGVIIARTMNLSLVADEEKVDTELAAIFADFDPSASNPSIAQWARPHVLACVKGGYINGIPSDSGNTVDFKAKESLNRGEAAKLIYLVMKEKKRL